MGKTISYPVHQQRAFVVSVPCAKKWHSKCYTIRCKCPCHDVKTWVPGLGLKSRP